MSNSNAIFIPRPAIAGRAGLAVRGRSSATGRRFDPAQLHGSLTPHFAFARVHLSPRNRETVTCKSVLAMRSAPESSSRDKNFSALRTDLRQRMPAVDTGILTIRASSHECKNGKKQGSGTPTDAYPTSAPFRVRRAQSAARSPLGVPPRLCANGTIHPKAQPGPGFVTHQLTRRVPRQPVWHFQRCTSRAGHSAGRLMPRPPGSDSDEPPRAGTASRSVLRGHRMTSLYVSEIDGHFSKPHREVKAFLFVQINRDVARSDFRTRVTVSRKISNKDLHKSKL